jgi:hypothetical protein
MARVERQLICQSIESRSKIFLNRTSEDYRKETRSQFPSSNILAWPKDAGIVGNEQVCLRIFRDVSFEFKVFCQFRVEFSFLYCQITGLRYYKRLITLWWIPQSVCGILRIFHRWWNFAGFAPTAINFMILWICFVSCVHLLKEF